MPCGGTLAALASGPDLAWSPSSRAAEGVETLWAWEWLESTVHAAGRAAERPVLTERNRCSRARRARKRSEIQAGPGAHAPDLEQIIQERREALHSTAVISASPLVSETELSYPPSDRPKTPDRSSESGYVVGPAVTPATADKLF
ncbi:hypothetical protein NDU88_001756 [Pleurodeles waltl]|uniref:Uncharacterized protein n=1 Tax=Pleurodeles waltl TaxID=8319 RepID=A0AAV7W2G5_PLEWA|nr:hypothetical protein NDU88_001756 [Pleurodeles waltl]